MLLGRILRRLRIVLCFEQLLGLVERLLLQRIGCRRREGDFAGDHASEVEALEDSLLFLNVVRRRCWKGALARDVLDHLLTRELNGDSL